MAYKTLGASFITQLAQGDGYSGVNETLQGYSRNGTVRW